jgi:hypothetical protein
LSGAEEARPPAAAQGERVVSSHLARKCNIHTNGVHECKEESASPSRHVRALATARPRPRRRPTHACQRGQGQANGRGAYLVVGWRGRRRCAVVRVGCSACKGVRCCDLVNNLVFSLSHCPPLSTHLFIKKCDSQPFPSDSTNFPLFFHFPSKACKLSSHVIPSFNSVGGVLSRC